MKITAKQLAELKQIVTDYHAAYVVNFCGTQSVTEAVLARLKELGLVKVKVNTAEDAFTYGKILQQLNTPEAAQMTFAQFRDYLKANPVVLSQVEKQAVDFAASRAAQFVVGLGNRIATDTGELLIEANARLRQKLIDDIRTQVSEGIAQRKSVQEIKSDLGHAMKDWTRDLDRIAATEISRAMNQGMAAQLRQDKGKEVEVAVLSRRGCCDACAKAYVGPDGAPIIWMLSHLEKNGTNYKKKKADQKPVVPPYHPNCACSLVHVPKRAGFDKNNNMIPRGPLGIRPHAQTKKRLSKASGGPLPYYGLRIYDPEPVGDIARGRLETPAGDHPCLLGPDDLASTAYVAHLPLGDFILLGFHHVEHAQAAVRASGGYPEGQVPLSFSEAPVHALVTWAQGPETAITLGEPAFHKAEAAPKPSPKRPEPRGRLLLPIGPLKKPGVRAPPKEMNLAKPERLVTTKPKVKPIPKVSPLASKPQPHPIPIADDTLHIEGDDKDPLHEDTVIVLRQRAKRMPVTELKPA